MKQRKPLERKTPLRSATPLKRSEFKRTPPTSGPVKPRKVPDTGPSTAVKRLVRKRASIKGVPMCEICGTKRGTNIHHRQPRGMGGCKLPYINKPSNLLLLCGFGNAIPGCHAEVENNRAYAESVFWLVPHPLKPEKIPVLRRGEYVWLRDDGEAIPLDLMEIAMWVEAA